MRGPRKLGGTLQVDPTNVRIIRCFTVGTGSAKDAVAIDFSTTTHGLFHAVAADSDTDAHKGTIAGVALEAWTAAGQIINVQVLGPVTEVAVNNSVVIGDKLVAGTVAGRLARAAALSTAAQVSEHTALGIATTAGTGSSGSQTASVYLLNPLGL